MAAGFQRRRRAIAGLVTRETARLLGVGLGLGLVGAGGAAFLLRAQIYGVSVADPVAYGVTVLVVAAVVALAVWLPVWRATRVNPAEVLRAE